MLLYEHPLSSYAQKVKIALREKGLDFTVEPPHALGSGKADGRFAAASPRNEVPALIDGDACIFDSTIILEYLEDKCPTPPLLPTEPAERADARMIEELCDTHYEAVNWGLREIRWFKRAKGEQAEKMKGTAARQTAELQGWLDREAGRAPVVQWRRARLGRSQRGALRQSLVPLRHRHAARIAARQVAPFASASGRRWPRRSASSRRPPSAWATPRPASPRARIRREYRDHRLEWMMKSGGIQIVLDGLARNNIRFAFGRWVDEEMPMRRSEERILTTHVGSLPRNPVLADLLIRDEAGEAVDQARAGPAERERGAACGRAAGGVPAST